MSAMRDPVRMAAVRRLIELERAVATAFGNLTDAALMHERFAAQAAELASALGEIGDGERAAATRALSEERRGVSIARRDASLWSVFDGAAFPKAGP